ncbi:hypothetical protein [Bacteroides sp. 51]|uniref:hypothetical protein n=1 Tax=Bacteroides sp. 51 TaxID=2302938 RepID=UPI0013D46971|nr:hypothetical protein [Bacteroides sp. 51]
MKRLIICFLLSSFMLPVISQEDYIDRLVRKGTELRELGCFENAVECYQNGLSVCPESMVIYFEMAYSYACMNEIEKSFECAEKAMIADDKAQELMYIWMFIISASENVKREMENKEKPDLEQLPANSGELEQIH